MKPIFHWPVTPTMINQYFADNKACVRTDLTGGLIVCDGNNPPAGYRSVYRDGHHGALDLKTFHGQAVYAAAKGKVYYIDTSAKSGLDVRIEHEIEGKKYRTIYEHLLTYKVEVGQEIEVGQQIGNADNTGWSSGDHLHFQVEQFMNGMWVKVDPLPLMSGLNAPQALLYTYQLLYLRQKLAQLVEALAHKIRP